MNKSTMQGEVVDAIKNASNYEELLNMADAGELDNYLIYSV